METTKKARTDAQIARDQGVSRQAILNRRSEGWTQEEIEKGERAVDRRRVYDTEIARHLGMTVAQAAQEQGVSRGEIYRRFKALRTGQKTRRKEPLVNDVLI